MSLKPITVHGHHGGPNPWKVIIVLEELKVPYETKIWEFPDMKTPPFEKMNPNGRSPVIEDPNTGITLWESGAIVEYLIETYDKQEQLTYTSSPQKYELKQWLHFQVSGQGPYFGQRAFFVLYHPEKVQSVLDRYANEIKRVCSVIDKHLKATGQEYLVGNKVTYADLSFAPWYWLTPKLMDGDFKEEQKKENPHFSAWLERILSRSAVSKVEKDREAAMAAGKH